MRSLYYNATFVLVSKGGLTQPEWSPCGEPEASAHVVYQAKTHYEIFSIESPPSGSRLKTTLDFGHVQLFIQGVRSADSGLYTCKATNKLGEAVSTTSIKVEGRQQEGMLRNVSKRAGLCELLGCCNLHKLYSSYCNFFTGSSAQVTLIYLILLLKNRSKLSYRYPNGL